MTGPPAPRQIDKWQDAEQNAAEWMRYWGYSDAVATPGGSDGGIDVRATDAYGQVKFVGAQIGRPALQRLVGAALHSGRELFFFSGSGFATPAIQYAEGARIALFTYDPWGRMTPINGEARAVISVAERLHQTGHDNAQVAKGSPAATGPREKHWARKYVAGFFAFWCLSTPFASMIPGWLDTEIYKGPWYEDIFGFFFFELLGVAFLAAHVALNRDGRVATALSNLRAR